MTGYIKAPDMWDPKVQEAVISGAPRCAQVSASAAAVVAPRFLPVSPLAAPSGLVTGKAPTATTGTNSAPCAAPSSPTGGADRGHLVGSELARSGVRGGRSGDYRVC